MPLNRAEFLIRKRFARRSTILLFDAACICGWSTVREIAELAGVSHRRAKLELVELVAGGWLVREQRGPKNQQRQVRFTARVAGIARDPTGGIAHDPAGEIAGDPTLPYGRARAPDPDLSLKGSSKIHASVHPGGSKGEPGTDARTEVSKVQTEPEIRAADVQWIAAQWQVSTTLARRYAVKLHEMGLETPRELRAYLDAARRGTHPAFAGLELARYPLAVACTPERLEPWRASRAPKLPPPAAIAEPRRVRRAVGAISTKEMEDFVRSKLRR